MLGGDDLGLRCDTVRVRRTVGTGVRGGLAALALLAVAACSGAGTDEESDEESSPSSAAPETSDTTATPEDTQTPEPAGPPPAEGPPELDRWFDATFTGTDLQLGGVREQTATFTSYDASYRSEGLLITGVLNVPAGEGPFPTLVLGHGYVDPAVYVSGQGMTRERGVLAEAGYIAFHVDYRNHAGSDDDPALDETHRFGYAVDLINAVHALRASDLPVDEERVAMFGRSMGGGAVLEALEMAPGVANAAIMYASVSSNSADNQRQFSDGGGFWDDLAATAGLPEDNPAYYEAASSRPHVARVTEPVLMIHGRSDDTCPPEWAEATYAALTQAGVDAELAWFEDGHAFGPQFTASMDAIDAFLTQQWG